MRSLLAACGTAVCSCACCLLLLCWCLLVAMRCAAAKQLAARGFLAARARTRVQKGQPCTPNPSILGVASRPPSSRLGLRPFVQSLSGPASCKTNQKQNGHRRVASGKIAIDRPLQQRKTRNFRRVLCPGGGENREGIAPQARSPRDAVSGVGLLHENDGDLDAHGRSECAHVHPSGV